MLARFGGLDPATPHDIVRQTFLEATKGSEGDWKKFLHDGFLAKSQAAEANGVSFAAEKVGSLLQQAKASPAPGKDSLEVVFHRDYSMDDGRYNNNGWLQEFPDPVTKIDLGKRVPDEREDRRGTGRGRQA